MKWLVFWLALGVSAPAFGQTYFGVLTTPANSGPGGSCCSKTATVDASNAQVPTDGTCAGCSVITQAQYLAYYNAIQASPNASRALSNALAVGVTLTCTASGTNNMSGTYVVTNDLATFLLSAQFFTGAQLQTFTITSTDGVAHQFKSAAAATTITTIILGFFNQWFSYQQSVAAGQSPTPPATSSSAC